MAIITAALWYVADRMDEPMRTLFFSLGIITMTGTFYAIAFPNATSGAFQSFVVVGASIFFLSFALILFVKMLPQVVQLIWQAATGRKR